MPPIELEFKDVVDASSGRTRSSPRTTTTTTAARSRKRSRRSGSSPTRLAIIDLTHGGSPYERMNYALLRSDPDEVFRFIWENAEVFGIDRDYRLRVESVGPTVRVGPNGLVVPEVVAAYVQSLELTAAELERQGVVLPARPQARDAAADMGRRRSHLRSVRPGEVPPGEALDDWPRQAPARLPRRAGPGRRTAGSASRCPTPGPALRRDARRRLAGRGGLVSRSPNRIGVRMYQVGFGDCFLLSFAYHSHLPTAGGSGTCSSTSAPPAGRRAARPLQRDRGRHRARGRAASSMRRHHPPPQGSPRRVRRRHRGGHDRDACAVVVLRPWTESPHAAASATGPALARPPSLAYAEGLDVAQAFAGRSCTRQGEQHGLRGRPRRHGAGATREQDAIQRLDDARRQCCRQTRVPLRRTADQPRRAHSRRHHHGARPAHDRPVAGRRRSTRRRSRVLAAPAQPARAHAEVRQGSPAVIRVANVTGRRQRSIPGRCAGSSSACAISRPTRSCVSSAASRTR